MNEEWRSISDFPGYEISNLGRFRSPFKGKILPGTIKAKGYVVVSLKRPGEAPKLMMIHRLVMLTFVGPPPPGKVCAHLNGNPADNRLENLRWVTQSENEGHKKLHGTARGGTPSKLTNDQIAEIQRLRLLGARFNEIGPRFGVSRETARLACKKITWRSAEARPV